MSAFVCSTDHFKALAIFAVARRHGSRNADPRYIDGMQQLEAYSDLSLACAYADVLYAWNVVSVLHRYPETTEETAPGEMEKPERINVTMRDLGAGKYNNLTPIAILKMCDCLEYQSCERDGWQDTAANRLLNTIRRAAIRLLPGYEGAPWDFHA